MELSGHFFIGSCPWILPSVSNLFLKLCDNWERRLFDFKAKIFVVAFRTVYFCALFPFENGLRLVLINRKLIIHIIYHHPLSYQEPPPPPFLNTYYG